MASLFETLNLRTTAVRGNNAVTVGIVIGQPVSKDSFFSLLIVGFEHSLNGSAAFRMSKVGRVCVCMYVCVCQGSVKPRDGCVMGALSYGYGSFD